MLSLRSIGERGLTLALLFIKNFQSLLKIGAREILMINSEQRKFRQAEIYGGK
jgi:hypothetical protein